MLKKHTKITLLSLGLVLAFMVGCSNIKILSSWKTEPENMKDFKTKKAFVIARTNSNAARIAMETEMALALNARGIQVLESYKKFPVFNEQSEISEERKEAIKKTLKEEGYGSIIMSSILDKQKTASTSSTGYYVGGAYSNYYPDYYGGFNNYYSQPYAYGGYYSGMSTYVNTGTTTSISTTYVVETVAYNMEAPEDKRLVFVVNARLQDPTDVDMTAKILVSSIVSALEKK